MREDIKDYQDTVVQKCDQYLTEVPMAQGLDTMERTMTRLDGILAGLSRDVHAQECKFVTLDGLEPLKKDLADLKDSQATNVESMVQHIQSTNNLILAKKSEMVDTMRDSAEADSAQPSGMVGVRNDLEFMDNAMSDTMDNDKVMESITGNINILDK